MDISSAIVLAGLLVWATIHLYNDIKKVSSWRVDQENPAMPNQEDGLDWSGTINAVANGLGDRTTNAACDAMSEVGSCEAAGIGHAVEHLGRFLHH